MIDLKAVSEALDKCWKEYEERAYFLEHEDMESWLRQEFCKTLGAIAEAGMTRTYLNPDDVREAIQEKVPGLTVRDTADGFIVEGGGDQLGVIRTKKKKVSIHSVQSHIGWDASFWTPEDAAALIVAITRFEALNAPRMEKYRKAKEKKEEERRKWVEAQMREISTKSTSDWEKEWEEERKEAERKKAQVQAQWDPFVEEISNAVGRPCTIERRKPFMSSHFFAYTITLNDGQQMVFRDYSRKPGNITPAIVATVPAIEALLPFAASKLSYAEGEYGMRYTDGWKKHKHKAFVEKFKDDETLLYLEQQLSSSKAAVLPTLTQRSIRINIFSPRLSNKALSFTLKKIGSREEADALVAATVHYYLVQRKHKSNFSFS